MKKMKWMTMAAAVTLSASLAFAAPHDGFGKGKRGRHGRGELGARMAAKLNLTDAQKQQVKDLNQSFRETNKAFFENAHALRKQARDARQANDTARLEALKPQLEAQRTQMKQMHDAKQQQILALLTPEQRTQWEAMKAEREARRGRRGPRGDRQ
jgi:periplasmic protein CpxP/Spy